MTNPKVSVIIPVFNAEKYICECLNSLLNQSISDLEIICVDDGSTDKSLSILKKYAAIDNRIVVKHQENQGAGAARNLGLQVAKGEYLSFLDSDDFFNTNMLEVCTKAMDNEQSDVLVYFAKQYNHATGEFTEMPWSLRIERCPDHSPFSPHEMSGYLFNTFQNWPWNKLFRHSFVKEKGLCFQEIPRTNDMAFVCLALALADKITVVKESFANYRVETGTSLQQTNDKAPLSFLDAYRETRRRLIECGIYEEYEQSFLNTVVVGTLYNLRSVKTTQAYRDILSYIKYHADDEFGLMNKPLDYYYDLNQISEFCRIKGQVKKVEKTILNPKVSVVIPSLNSRAYIRECIESVLEQTLEDIEVFCVDAGSTDGTVDILNEYAALDKRIIIIHSEKKSYGYQMNLGIKAARGEYLAIVESDDYIIPNTYQELYKVAKEKNIEVLKADFRIFIGEKNNHKFTFRKIVSNNNYYNKILDPYKDIKVFDCNNVPWSGLYSLKFLKDNNILLNETPGASYQDNGLWFQCFTQSHRIYFYNKSYYRLRRDNPESSIYSKNKVFCMCEEYDFIREFLNKDIVLKERFAPICAYKRFANYMWTLGRISEEFKLLFLKRFADDFKKLEANGEIEPDLFNKDQWDKLQWIMKDPEDYYYRTSKIDYNFLRCLPPERYPEILKRWFKEKTKQDLNLDNPKTFNEKTQWLKLYDNTDLKTRLADKYLVRDWIKEKIGDEYLIPLLGVWDNFDDIDFDHLPKSFVLKTNHGCGFNIIVKDKSKFDVADAKKKINKWLKTNFALCNGLELQYGDIKPKIIAETYLENGNDDLYDYKVFCFNGKPNCVMYLSERRIGLKMAFYDLKWNKLPFVYSYPMNKENIQKPEKLDLMIQLAEKLARDFAFVRVDFYVLNDGSIKFGEMTFSSASGHCTWNPQTQNDKFGALLTLPSRRHPLPEKSFAEKGVEPLLVEFARPKTDDEIKRDAETKKNQELLKLRKENQELLKLRKENQELTLIKIKNSKAFRVGEGLAWPVRKLRNLLR